MKTPPVRISEIRPTHPDDRLGVIDADVTDGLDRVGIHLRFDAETGPGKALLMLARASLEVVVRASEIRRERATLPDRYMEGGRWNG